MARPGIYFTGLGSVLAILILLSSQADAQYRTKYPLPAPSIPGSFGVNIHFNHPVAGEMKAIQDLGARWIRQDFAWSGIEKSKGVYDFGEYDSLLKDLQAADIRPIFILDYGNDLYQKGAPRSPEARAAFAKFATAAVTHFKNQGIVWEMWNEHNIPQFWSPAANVDEYTALALETGKAIREAAPEEWFIGPGVSGVDLTFVEKCLQAGMLKYWDAVSVHPYRSSNPEAAIPELYRLSAMVDRYAPKGKSIPIISSEWGYSELYSGLDLVRQGKYLPRELLTCVYSGARIAIWYDWKDDGKDPKEPEHHFGAVYQNLSPKPAAKAAHLLTQTLDGFRYSKRLSVGADDDFCLLFTNGKDIWLTAWTASAGFHETTLPASPGHFEVLSIDGKRTQVQAQKGGLRLLFTDTVQFIRPTEPNQLLSLAAAWGELPPLIVNRNYGDTYQKVMAVSRGEWSPEDGALKAHLILQDYSAVQDSAAMNLVTSQDFTLKSGFKQALDDIPGTGTRRETGTRLKATLSIDGVGTLTQESNIVPQNPLLLTVLPYSAGKVPVMLSNPTGTPFKGRLQINAGQAEAPVDLANGQKELLTYLTFPADAAKEAFTVRLQERPGQAVQTEEKLVLSPEVTRESQEKTTPKANSAFVTVIQTRPLSFESLENFDPAKPGQLLKSGYNIRPDGDEKVSSEIHQSIASDLPAGLPEGYSHALKISYRFSPGWKFLQLLFNKHLDLPKQPAELGMWIYSDGSGNNLRMRFQDATGQTFQAASEDLNWKGWRFILFKLDNTGAYWGGANDGIIHRPIAIETPLLIDSAGAKGGSGEVLVTGLTLIYTLTADGNESVK